MTSQHDPQPWKRPIHSARRVQLALKQSISSLSQKTPNFEDDENDEVLDVPSTQNIDQALKSLYSGTVWDNLNSTRDTPSSYVPGIEYDWILDGKDEWKQDGIESAELLNELAESSNLQALLQEIAENETPWSSSDESESDDEEFGEFQSAEFQSEQPNEPSVVDSSFVTPREQSESPRVDSDRVIDRCSSEAVAADEKGSMDPPQWFTPQEFASPQLKRPGSVSHEVAQAETPFASEMSSRWADDSLSKSQPLSLQEEDEKLRSSVSPGSDLAEVCNTTVDTPVAQDSIRVKESPVLTTPKTNLRSSPTTVEEPPISMQLSVTDLHHREARFTRRIQQYYQEKHFPQQLPEESEITRLEDLDLPDYYFTNPDLDDTVRVLDSLPWSYVRDLSSSDDQDYASSDLALWDETMTNKLCHLDTALEKVQVQLLEQVQPRRSELKQANDLIHEWEQNLRLANMYWGRLKESIEGAVGVEEDASGLIGPTILLDAWQQREEYHDLSKVFDQLASVWAKEKELLERIDAFNAREGSALAEYQDIIQLTQRVRDIICTGELSRLSCLDGMRGRLGEMGQRFWNRLHSLAGSLVMRCCRRIAFNWTEYESLLKAAIDLDDRSTESDHNSAHLARSWSNNLLTALCNESDRAFAMALLDPGGSEDSEFEKELSQLSIEVDLDWGDRAKLRTVTHNLVTIRFDFEASLNCFPGVFLRLCSLLTDVLHAHFLFTQWHRTPFSEQCRDAAVLHEIREGDSELLDGQLQEILSMIIESREKLWDYCENVLIKCLDEYVNFASKRQLFEQSEHGIDDSIWADDLEGLHEVLVFADRFLLLKSSFFEDSGRASGLASLHDTRCDSVLYRTLGDVFRKHLRCVHVEAMNTLGRLLSRESWVLVSFDLPPEPERTEDSVLTIETILFGALKAAASKHTKTQCTNWSGVQGQHGLLLDFVRYESDGNPFERIGKERVAFNGFEIPAAEIRSQEFNSDVYGPLSTLLGEQDGGCPRIASESVAGGLVVWVSRLLAVMQKLPLIVEDVSAVFANLVDLYLTTVLRICAGNAKRERILLGMEPPCPLFPIGDVGQQNSPTTEKKRPSSPLFGSFRKERRPSKSRPISRPRSAIPVTLEADICAPLPKDEGEVSQVRRFVERAQDSLEGAVNLNMVDSWIVDPVYSADSSEETACGVARVLEKREGAAFSCYIVASLVKVACSVAQSNMTSSFLQGRFVEDIAPLESYARASLEITPTLVSVACQMSCVRAVAGMEVVKDIVTVAAGWEECKLNEQSNGYVEELCERCALIWGFLSASAKLPVAAMNATWSKIITAACLSLLEGFARVPFCSTEGRALMTLDLASFFAGVSPDAVTERLETRDLLFTPPKVDPELGMRYVDTYIKVFYYPKEDVMGWIADNCGMYRFNHSLALITAAAGNPEESPENAVADLVEKVEEIYQRPQE